MLNKINNYLKITENISTSGQPTVEDIALISESGFKVIINLGLDGENYSLNNEAELVQILGMKYIHIPVKFDNPKISDYKKFELEMKMLKLSKVFVHCAANKRVSIFLALYLMREYDWSKSDVNNMIIEIWNPNECWKEFFSRVSNAETTHS